MKINPKSMKSISVLIFLTFLSITLMSQNLPNDVDPNNLKNIRVDDLNDEQVLSLIKQNQSAGLTLEQAQQVAIKKGMSPIEASKLKSRASNLQSGGRAGSSVSSSVEDSILKSIKKEAEVSDFLSDMQNVNSNAPLQVSVVGQEYFRSGNIKVFDRSSDAKAPANYIISVGDEIAVSVFGFSYYNEVLKVDTKGAINPTQIGPIFVKGLTYDKAKSLIRSKLSQYFDLSNNKIEISLAYSRSITVNIVGEVISPGSYKIPAINTAFNALILAGGPSDIGTLRDIQVRRAGKIIKTLDVYAFLNDPNSKQDFFLEDNDFIVVGTSKKLVSIGGEVKKYGTFELLEKEQLRDLLKLTGGLNANAYTGKIQISRTTPTETKIIMLNLDSLLSNEKNDFVLKNGDKITIRKNVSELINVLIIGGAVNFPGVYDFKPNTKVLDLIKQAGGFKQDAKFDNAFIVRVKEDQTKEYIKLNLNEIKSNPKSSNNMVLNPMDQLTILSNYDFQTDYIVTVLGAVKKQQELVFVKGMTLGDALRQVGGFTIDAENLRIEVSRLNFFSADYKEGDVVKVIVDRLKIDDHTLTLNSEQEKYVLQPYDQIIVRTVPNFSPLKMVEINGEVKYPGKYVILSKDEKISSLIKRAGGLTKYAFVEGATYFRPELAGGYVVMDMTKILKNENSKYNYILRPGARVEIPVVTDFISIRGSSIRTLRVFDTTQVNTPYVSGHRAGYYIRKFGNGFGEDAWKKKTYVVQPNSKVNKTRNFILFKVYPRVTKGSTIYVVTKPVKKKEDKTDKIRFDVNKFIENTTVKITGLVTLYIIFRQLR